MIIFRHCDNRSPFLQESIDQPAARWHDKGEGPVQYFADTPDGAWAEFLRHEEIRDPDDLKTVTRALWAVEIENPPRTCPQLPPHVLTGPKSTYERCRQEARRLRKQQGASGLTAPSAALKEGEARGSLVDVVLKPGPSRDGRVYVLFGKRPRLVGWKATSNGQPSADLLAKIRHF